MRMDRRWRRLLGELTTLMKATLTLRTFSSPIWHEHGRATSLLPIPDPHRYDPVMLDAERVAYMMFPACLPSAWICPECLASNQKIFGIDDCILRFDGPTD